MTLPVLRKVAELVRGGATIVGPRPVKSPSLVGYPGADGELASIAADVWGDLDGVSRTKRLYEKGTVVWGQSLVDVLTAASVSPDVEYERPLDGELAWLHRRVGDADVYYVSSTAEHAHDVVMRFRTGGKEAELWHPDTGMLEPASYTISDGRTTVHVPMTEHDALFVVFRRPAALPTRTVPRATRTTLATVQGPWPVRFAAGLGAPTSMA